MKINIVILVFFLSDGMGELGDGWRRSAGFNSFDSDIVFVLSSHIEEHNFFCQPIRARGPSV